MLAYIGKLGVHHHNSLQATIACKACLVKPCERVHLNLTVGTVTVYLADAHHSAVLIAGSRCAGGWLTGPPPLQPVSLAVWLTLPSGWPMALSAGWAAATMASQYSFVTQSAVVASLKAVYLQRCVTHSFVGKTKGLSHCEHSFPADFCSMFTVFHAAAHLHLSCVESLHLGSPVEHLA